LSHPLQATQDVHGPQAGAPVSHDGGSSPPRDGGGPDGGEGRGRRRQREQQETSRRAVHGLSVAGGGCENGSACHARTSTAKRSACSESAHRAPSGCEVHLWPHNPSGHAAHPLWAGPWHRTAAAERTSRHRAPRFHASAPSISSKLFNSSSFFLPAAFSLATPHQLYTIAI